MNNPKPVFAHDLMEIAREVGLLGLIAANPDANAALERFAVKLAIKEMACAEPPAAQSAGHEPIPIGRVQVGSIGITFIPDADAWRMGDEYEVFANAAPVNGGERAVAWFTDDHLTDKSATTWDKATAERWIAKGWPVWNLFRSVPHPGKLGDGLRKFLDAAAGDGLVCNGVDAADLYVELFGDIPLNTAVDICSMQPNQPGTFDGMRPVVPVTYSNTTAERAADAQHKALDARAAEHVRLGLYEDKAADTQKVGYVIVPIEPTCDMLENGSIGTNYDLSQDTCLTVWRAMINYVLCTESQSSAALTSPAKVGIDYSGSAKRLMASDWHDLPIGKVGGDELPEMIETADGKNALCTSGRSKDWLMYKHADGQWVSLRKALPTEIEWAIALHRARAALSADSGEPIAWEATTPAYTRYVTDSRYQQFRDETKRWYQPYRCAHCAALSADGGEPDRKKPGNCHKCGLPKVANPHPDAGKPDHYLNVGCPTECLPCTVGSRHAWAQQAMKDRADAQRYRGLVMYSVSTDEDGYLRIMFETSRQGASHPPEDRKEWIDCDVDNAIAANQAKGEA